jgi:hypothetical protein
MKDTVISANRKKTELIIFAGCLLLAILLNVYAIVSYNTQWKELYSTWYVMILLSLVFYFLILVLRLIGAGIVKLFRFFNRQTA